MGNKTPNMGIYKPSTSEELYGSAFNAGLNNVDSHDHTGGTNKGKKLGTDSLEDGAVTPAKLSSEIASESTIQTTDATTTEIASIPVAESQAVTIKGEMIALRDDATEALGSDFFAVFHRPTSSNVQIISTATISNKENFSGSPALTIVADTINQTVSLRVTGEAAKTINWHIAYSSLYQPEN